MELSKLLGEKDFITVKDLLSAEPYNLIVKESDRHKNLYLIKYDQIKTNFDEAVCSECRGVILEKNTNKIICWPFNKFWNLGERRAANVDWETARVQEKYDGSLVKIFYYNGEWIVGTNGTINAKDAKIQFQQDPSLSTFYDIFLQCFNGTRDAKNLRDFPFEALDTQYTYMFEAMHPSRRIVVDYQFPELRHIGTRHRETHQEIDFHLSHHINIPRAELIPLTNNPEACQIFLKSKNNPLAYEGVIVVDANFNRVKIKTKEYVRAHLVCTRERDPKFAAIHAIVIAESSEYFCYLTQLEKTEFLQMEFAFTNLVNTLSVFTVDLERRAVRECHTDEITFKKFMAIESRKGLIDTRFHACIMQVLSYDDISSVTDPDREDSLVTKMNYRIRAYLAEKHRKYNIAKVATLFDILEKQGFLVNLS